MAWSDYRLCDVCEAKAFYDATLDYDERHLAADGTLMPGHNCGDMRVLCRKCVATHEIIVRAKGDAG